MGTAGPARKPRRGVRTGARATLVVVAVTIGTLALASPPALAVTTHPFTGSFGPEGPLSATTFANVQSVAVDQSSGDLYVYDTGAAGGSIYKFNAAGEPVGFSALASNVITGVGGAYADGNELAVDSSSGPTKGDIYVANVSHIGIYGADGKPVEVAGKPAELNGEVAPGVPWGEACGVAVDPAGNVYVGLAGAGRNVNRYTPTGPAGTPVANGDYTSSLWSFPAEACNIAVDPEGNTYVDTYEVGPVTKYEASQFQTRAQFEAGGEVPASGSTVDAKGSTLAVDPAPASHVLYVDEHVEQGGLLAEYDTTGETKRLGMFGAAGSGALNGSSYGVAGNAAGEVYAASGSGLVNIYGPREVVKAQIESEFATRVTSSSARLGAQLNPGGVDTTYSFQLGTEDCSEHPAGCPNMSAAGAGGDAGSGESGVPLATSPEGLSANTTYHYRVVAHNVNGTVDGPDHSFTTQGPGRPTALPDGRVYEMVSPLEKSNALLTGIDGFPTGTAGGVVQAAAGGEAIAYTSNGAFANPAGAPLSSSYLATRAAGGWSTSSLIPPIASGSYFPVGQGGPYKAFSEDLSAGVFVNGENKPIQNPPLPGTHAPAGYQDFYVQQLLSGGFQAVLNTTPAESPASFNLAFRGATPDLTHMVFATGAALTPDATEGSTSNANLYEWFAGELRLINILPKEAKGTPGAVLGADQESYPGGLHPISNDGSRIFFSDGGHLYVRENGATTVQVDRGLGGGEGTFQTAGSEGSRVFFTSAGDLYEFDLASEQLSDLTVGAPGSAEVQRVLGAGEDGSYVYFVANGVLASGASHGHCDIHITGGGAQTCNLYVWHRGSPTGTTRFIATLSEEDNREANLYNFQARGAADDWAPQITNRTSRVTPDGLGIAFMSDNNLKGYDNTPVDRSACGHITQETEPPSFVSTPCEEVYVYDAAGEGRLSCASCNRTGARPQGASSIPGGTQFELSGAIYQSRVLSDVNAQGFAEGPRVFFNSSDALVPQDVNGKPDVYQWEQAGRGGCLSTSASYSETSGGCVTLISSGTSDTESSFVDADASGKNVFLLTTQQLVSGDTDHLFDLYDAREAGGFPTAPAQPACTGTGCQGVPPPAPIFATPSSATFTGVGNFPGGRGSHPSKPKPKKKPTRCPRGKHRTHGKCTKAKAKHNHRPKAKKADRASRTKRISSNRRTRS